ncbi:hypothetical protein VD659_11995 [Herbiconiux sp. 11R-BC]|uniref:OmpL47-type beta-barrel domain-containing protein n=1 Tax=Herbiconiux sp. 11R-BC TaxID=3111637 RepID=UPI003BFBDE19
MTVRQNGADTVQPVTWAVDGALDRPGMVTITGTLPDFGGRTFSRSVPVLPPGLRYVVDAGGQQTADWTAIIAAARAAGPVYNTAGDQSFGADPQSGKNWGYLGDANGVSGDAAGDIYSTLRYATGGSDLSYELDGLRPGSYTVYAGYADPWPWDDRGADVSINGTLVEHDHDYDSADQAATYPDAVVGADGKLTFSLAPTRGHDVQLSWLMVSDPTAPDEVGPELAVTTSPAVADGAAGWYVGETRVGATASDPSGVAGVEYRIGDTGTWSPYAAPIAAGEGETRYEFRATDTLGNVSAPQDITVKRDATPPTSTVISTPGSGSATVSIAASDAVSGVADTRYRIDTGDWQQYTAPFTISDVGQHDVAVVSTDVAGNVESSHTTPVDVAPVGGGTPTLALSVADVAAGGSVVLSGAGFAPGSTVGIELHSTPVQLGSVVVPADGRLSFEAVIPAGTPAGLHHVVVVLADGSQVSAALTVGEEGPNVPATPVAEAGAGTSVAAAASAGGPAGRDPAARRPRGDRRRWCIPRAAASNRVALIPSPGHSVGCPGARAGRATAPPAGAAAGGRPRCPPRPPPAGRRSRACRPSRGH